MADIVIINPRFEISYWGMEHALPFMGKRANLPVACLPLLAALTPGEHTRHADRRERRGDRLGALRRADIVGITGMSVQRFRMKEILTELKRRGVFTVVGGPVGHRAGRLLRRPGRRRSSSARPRRPGRGSSRSGKQGRHQTATSRSRRPTCRRCRRRGSTC